MGVKIDAMVTDYREQIRLRLLEKSERDRFDQPLETCHGLESSCIGSRYRRYVAEVNGE